MIRYGLFIVVLGLIVVAFGLLIDVYSTMFTFKIPIGAQVAFLGRIVRVADHHWGNGIGAAHDPAAYEYVFEDDPPPDTVTPLWDRDHWTHSHRSAVRESKGTKQFNQLRQFHQLADYRRP